jgi:hypothetical protein
MKRIYDDTPEDTQQPFWSAVFKDIPGASEMFGSRPTLDYFGQPVQRSLYERVPGIGRMVVVEKDPVDPVALAMKEKGIIIPELKKTINLNQSDFPSKAKYKASTEERASKALTNALTPDEWYDFVRATGPKIKAVAKEIAASGMTTAEAQSQLIKRVDKIRDTAKKNYVRTGQF